MCYSDITVKIIPVRLPDSTIQRLEHLIGYLSWKLSHRDEGSPATRSDSIRECLQRGIAQIEQERMVDMAAGRYRTQG
jgi:ABC-type phosphate/phosphonate transport system substrate-binding protein